MYEPFYYSQLNQRDSWKQPGTLEATNTQLSKYFRRYLAMKAFSIYDWKGTPETWDIAYFKYSLMVYGSVAVFKTDKFGIMPQVCGFSGYNFFYRPTTAVIANPLLDKTYHLEIGSQCELIRLSPDWLGIADLIGHYADQMALIVSSIVCNLYNSRLSYVFTAETTAMAESFKKMFDNLSEGNPAVFADKRLFREDGTPNWTAFQQDVKGTYIIDLLQAAEQALLVDFYTQIGIPNVNYEKKERLLVSEISSNQFATECLADLWLRTMTETADKVNSLFGLSLSVDYTEALKKQLEAAERQQEMQEQMMQGGKEQGRNAGFSGHSNAQTRGER